MTSLNSDDFLYTKTTSVSYGASGGIFEINIAQPSVISGFIESGKSFYFSQHHFLNGEQYFNLITYLGISEENSYLNSSGILFLHYFNTEFNNWKVVNIFHKGISEDFVTRTNGSVLIVNSKFNSTESEFSRSSSTSSYLPNFSFTYQDSIYDGVGNFTGYEHLFVKCPIFTLSELVLIKTTTINDNIYLYITPFDKDLYLNQGYEEWFGVHFEAVADINNCYVVLYRKGQVLKIFENGVLISTVEYQYQGALEFGTGYSYDWQPTPRSVYLADQSSGLIVFAALPMDGVNINYYYKSNFTSLQIDDETSLIDCIGTHLLRTKKWVKPLNYQYALLESVDPFVEVSHSNYERVNLVPLNDNWSLPVFGNGFFYNTRPISFKPINATIVGWALINATENFNMLVREFPEPIICTPSQPGPYFPVGSLNFTIR